MTTLGFVGLGDMGFPMARRLLETGNQVVAWNRSGAKLESLVADGAIAANSPADVMSRADLIGICVSSHQAVEEVGWGPRGLFSVRAVNRKFIADFSTGAPSAAVSFARRCATVGASWVDAPVSGGTRGAANGSLIIFAGGDSEAIAMLKPLFQPLSSRLTHMGPSGMGQTTKICNQMITACNLLLIGEMLALARKAGLNVDALPEALKGGFADSLPLQIFGPRMAAHRFEPRLGAIALMEKDIALASALAAETSAYTPMLDRARGIYAAVHGTADLNISADISQLIGLFEAPPSGAPS